MEMTTIITFVIPCTDEYFFEYDHYNVVEGTDTNTEVSLTVKRRGVLAAQNIGKNGIK